MARILIVDTVCPTPYDSTTIKDKGLGGTEATVIRVAEELGKRHEVHVMQHVRKEVSLSGRAAYAPIIPKILERQKWDAIIALRDANALGWIRVLNKAPLFLWCHDISTPDFTRQYRLIRGTGATIVTVSDYHKTQTIEAFKAMTETVPFIRRVYNPIDQELNPNDTPIDKNKLVFFSSPHKGLEYTVEVFKNARSFLPELRLYIANPGYLPSYAAECDGIINLGSLPHAQVVDEVRSALCVFYPNTVFPETFGLVFAEANAVGTPVLAHTMGAAHEVLSASNPPFDCRQPRTVIDKLISWHGMNRPVVQAKDEFRIKEVGQAWERLLKL
jgi:glycosyltransferase involved in cell wall biosynthesis